MPKAANEDTVSFHAEMVSKHDTRNAELTESPFGHHESLEWTTAEKRIVRKLDMTLLPIVWILYMFNYLDRNNIAQARLDKLEEDTGLVGNEFNVAVSILNAFFMLSAWYTRKELALRTAVLYSGLVLATAFSGLIAAGIFAGLSDKAGLHGWQWLFILEGAGSVLAALFAFVLLPDFPESETGSGRWLFNNEERHLARQRIALDRVSLPETERTVWHGLGLAVKDIRTWIFVIILCANHTAYGFNNFFPTIVNSMHLGSRTITLVLTAPPYLVGAVVSFLVAYSSDHFNERGYHISGPMLVAIVGFIISVATLNNAARYTASFLYCSGAFAANAAVYSWAASSLNQTPEKRACATAIINLLSQLGNIWSPYFFPASDGPRYVMAMLLMMAFSALSIAASMLMKFLLKRENKKLLAQGQQTGHEVRLYTT
ncbi:hypothetical protein NW755_013426 [Fusarium falciforme]|uniref:Major facilitator superfamily (MFS) profile domain-containing protein n=1 Tax=Fusarium falciforme TaxID=195108 RepID=A0A9W8QTA0_9HYPO|nr:hypothetical protein NW755_013426 [Fusarium falciforme]